jgi:hypothetical protein
MQCKRRFRVFHCCEMNLVGPKNAKAFVKAPKNQALTAAQDLEMGLH